jgi:hypothetical protein
MNCSRQRQNWITLGNTLNEFKASIPQKRLATGTSKVSTGNINETFKTIDALFKDENNPDVSG